MKAGKYSPSLALALLTAACGGAPSTPATSAAHSTPPPASPVAAPTASAGAFPQDDFRKTQPDAARPRPFQLPAVQSFQLANGIGVYLVEKHELPLISASLQFEGGEINDPKNKVGLASVCMDMLSEGTKKLDKMAFNEALADIASHISSRANSDTQEVSFRTLSTHLDRTFELFADTLRTPGLRKTEFDRIVQQRLERLKQTKGSAPSIARRLADSVLYGPAHPRGQIVTKKSFKRLRVSDCKRYHRTYIKPKGAKLFVVGDMTQDQVRAKFEQGLSGWKGNPKSSVVKKKPKSRAGKLFFVNVPGAAQSAIRVMHFGPKRKADDYFANSMMSAVLGGGFSGRINMNLREDKGYSYGAYGSFSYERDHGTFSAGTSVRSDSTYQSVLEVMHEIQNLQSGAKNVTEAELKREQNGAILGLPARFATAAKSLNMYRRLVYYDLPLDYWNHYVENVGKVTLGQATASAGTHLKPDDALILVVGDAKAAVIQHKDGKNEPLLDASGKQMTLLASLQKLANSGQVGSGKLVVLDADGKAARSL